MGWQEEAIITCKENESRDNIMDWVDAQIDVQ